MNKITALLLVVLLCMNLFACNKNKGKGDEQNNYDGDTTGDGTTSPDGSENTSGESDGTSESNTGSNEENSQTVYIYSVESNRFHLETCHRINQISEENRAEESDVNLLLSQNYFPCKTCKPIPDYDYGKLDNSDNAGLSGNPEIVECLESECTYVINKSTKKFHDPYCHKVSDINQKNKGFVKNTREELIELDFEACKVCNP